jgi:threonine dehydratase
VVIENNNLSISNASKRLTPFLHRTPILKSEFLNQKLGHNFFFKAEPLQKVGAFKDALKIGVNHPIFSKGVRRQP